MSESIESMSRIVKILSVLFPFGIMYFIGLIIYSTAFELDQRIIPVSLIAFIILFVVCIVETLKEKPDGDDKR